MCLVGGVGNMTGSTGWIGGIQMPTTNAPVAVSPSVIRGALSVATPATAGPRASQAVIAQEQDRIRLSRLPSSQNGQAPTVKATLLGSNAN